MPDIFSFSVPIGFCSVNKTEIKALRIAHGFQSSEHSGGRRFGLCD